MPTSVGPLINENVFWVLSMNGLFRLTAPQPIKSHEPYLQVLDTNFVENTVSFRSIVTQQQHQQSPSLNAKVCL